MKIRYSDEKKIFNIHTDNIPYLSFDMLDKMGVPNLYSTRYISYDEESGDGITGLKLAVMKTDNIAEAAPVVINNRNELARLLRSDIRHECSVVQKHTNNVIVVTPSDLGPDWPGKIPPHRRNADGMVTDIPDALLTIYGGDCPPIYIADPVRKAIGLIHAGWRGTLGQIPAVAIRLMKERFGCDPSDMFVCIGPGICRECYEMGDEVYDAFASEWGEDAASRVFRKYPGSDEDGREIEGGRYHLDLREANYMTVSEAGIPADHVAISNVCTKCNVNIFYSFRARRMENEQAAMMVNKFGPINSMH